MAQYCAMKLLVSGVAASPGLARGVARVLTRLDDPERRPLNAGEILVTIVTDPMSFVEIIESAAALVTDLGGLTSHPAILARELGIPCVVGTREATTVIADVTMIVVDGAAGNVYTE